MVESVIYQIENRTKVEALIGLAIMSLITLLGEKIYTGEPIPIELFWGLAVLFAAYVSLMILSYVRFYIEKMVYLKEQEVMNKIQLFTLDKEIVKLGLVKDIKALEAGAIDG